MPGTYKGKGRNDGRECSRVQQPSRRRRRCSLIGWGKPRGRLLLLAGPKARYAVLSTISQHGLLCIRPVLKASLPVFLALISWCILGHCAFCLLLYSPFVPFYSRCIPNSWSLCFSAVGFCFFFTVLPFFCLYSMNLQLID